MPPRKGVPCLNLFIDDMAAHLFRTKESTLALGARVKLWIVAYDQSPPGTVPNDDEWLARHAEVTARQWERIRCELIPTWREAPGGRLLMRRVAEAHDRAGSVSDVRSAAGKAGADAKWHGKRMANARQEPKQTDGKSMASSSFSSSSSSVEEKTSPEPIAIPDFPCVGRSNQPKTWGLTGAHLAELQEAYPKIDARGQALEARQWCRDNPGDRKTHRGMKRFINAWMQRNQNRGGNHRPRREEPPAGPTAPSDRESEDLLESLRREEQKYLGTR